MRYRNQFFVKKLRAAIEGVVLAISIDGLIGSKQLGYFLADLAPALKPSLPWKALLPYKARVICGLCKVMKA